MASGAERAGLPGNAPVLAERDASIDLACGQKYLEAASRSPGPITRSAGDATILNGFWKLPRVFKANERARPHRLKGPGPSPYRMKRRAQVTGIPLLRDFRDPLSLRQPEGVELFRRRSEIAELVG